MNSNSLIINVFFLRADANVDNLADDLQEDQRQHLMNPFFFLLDFSLKNTQPLRRSVSAGRSFSFIFLDIEKIVLC